MRVVTLVLLFSAAICCSAMGIAGKKNVVCYFGSWAVYRQGNGNFKIEDIDANLCTHLTYAFANLNADGSIVMDDPWADAADGKDGYNIFNNLRKKNPELKTIIGIGGWNAGSTTFSTVFRSSELRSKFVKNAVDYVKQYGFNGLDLDWEYPNQRGGVSEDIDAFTETAKELRAAFDQEGLLLTVAVGAAKSSASLSYNIKEMSKYFDIINLMTYDLHGPWENVVGLNAPLYPRKDESEESKEILNVKACIEYWLSEGAPPEKLALGIPTYGHTFYLADASKSYIGAPASGAGMSGPYTGQAGTYGYNEVCELLKTGWTTINDPEQEAPYKVQGTNWLSYDDPTSVAKKAQLALEYNLGGAMIWSIETDDFLGFSGEKYGLLKAINSVFNGNIPPSPTSTTDTSKTTSYISSTNTSPLSSSQKPVTSTEMPNLCTQPGYIRDPNDCAVFYYCEESPDNVFIPVKFHCADGEYFDLSSDTCNFSYNVDC